MKKNIEVKNTIFFAVASFILIIFIISAINGGLKRGIDESTRNSALRMNNMLRILNALDTENDQYELLYKGEKQGRAYIEIRFKNSDWSRNTKDDLLGILSREGWIGVHDGLFCKNDASLTLAGGDVTVGEGYTHVVMVYSNLSIKACGNTLNQSH